MKIGYIRVSTQEQNSMRQEVLMESLGVYYKWKECDPYADQYQ